MTEYRITEAAKEDEWKDEICGFVKGNYYLHKGRYEWLLGHKGHTIALMSKVFNFDYDVKAWADTEIAKYEAAGEARQAKKDGEAFLLDKITKHIADLALCVSLLTSRFKEDK